jgi:hypothetical protein
VRSPKSLAVEVTTDNDGVKPRLEGQPSDKGYFWHQGVVLEVASEKFEKDTTVTVKISSPESNQFVSNVLLQIEVQPAIRLFPDMIFFGEVSASNIAETTLELESLIPFNLIAVETGNSALQAEYNSSQFICQHTVRLTFTPSKNEQFYGGTVRLKTNVPEQEVITVPYIIKTK